MRNKYSTIKVLVSSCLLGAKVRYDGKIINIKHPFLEKLHKEKSIISCCQEKLAGFKIPRIPAEIQNNNHQNKNDIRVIQSDGIDITNKFLLGARYALNIAKNNNIRIAILKDYSPSCGSNFIYDGTFSGNTISGVALSR